jgi:hypothetical protein
MRMKGTISMYAKLIKIRHQFLDRHTETTFIQLDLFRPE